MARVAILDCHQLSPDFFMLSKSGSGDVTFLIKIVNKCLIYCNVYARDSFSATLKEGVTVTVNGAAQTLISNDRNSAGTPVTTVYTGPTYTGGTAIINGISGEAAKSNDEWSIPCLLTLKANTNYVLELDFSGTLEYEIYLGLYEYR